MKRKATRQRARTKTVPYDIAEQLRNPEEMAAYLDAWFEEAPGLRVRWAMSPGRAG